MKSGSNINFLLYKILNSIRSLDTFPLRCSLLGATRLATPSAAAGGASPMPPRPGRHRSSRLEVRRRARMAAVGFFLLPPYLSLRGNRPVRTAPQVTMRPDPSNFLPDPASGGRIWLRVQLWRYKCRSGAGRSDPLAAPTAAGYGPTRRGALPAAVLAGSSHVAGHF